MTSKENIMASTRREFLKGGAWLGAAAMVGGCATRGAWRTNPPLGIVDIDLGKFDIMCGRVNRSKEMKWAG